VGYKIYRGEALQIGTSATNLVFDTSFAGFHRLLISVSAYDAAGNNSGQIRLVKRDHSGRNIGPVIPFIAYPSSIAVGQSSTLFLTVTGSPAPTLSINCERWHGQRFFESSHGHNDLYAIRDHSGRRIGQPNGDVVTVDGKLSSQTPRFLPRVHDRAIRRRHFRLISYDSAAASDNVG